MVTKNVRGADKGGGSGELSGMSASIPREIKRVEKRLLMEKLKTGSK